MSLFTVFGFCMTITRFEDLECWQEARKLNLVYAAARRSESLQGDLRFAGQITAAAVSVMNNIAEGWASQSNAEFIRFLTYSRRSCAEVQNCGYVALDQKYMNEAVFEEIYDQALKTLKIIDGLLRYLRSQRPQRSQPSKRS